MTAPFTLTAARLCHEANRAVQRMTGEELNPPWDEAPEWMKTSTMLGVVGILEGNTPSQSHAAWCQERAAAGWVWGPVKDIDAKVHPCLVPYEDLPPEQKLKDDLFSSIVLALRDDQAQVN